METTADLVLRGCLLQKLLLPNQPKEKKNRNFYKSAVMSLTKSEGIKDSTPKFWKEIEERKTSVRGMF